MPAGLEQPEGPAPCSTAAGHRLVNSFLKICFMRWKLAIVCYLRSYTYKVFTFKSHIFSDLVWENALNVPHTLQQWWIESVLELVKYIYKFHGLVFNEIYLFWPGVSFFQIMCEAILIVFVREDHWKVFVNRYKNEAESSKNSAGVLVQSVNHATGKNTWKVRTCQNIRYLESSSWRADIFFSPNM